MTTILRAMGHTVTALDSVDGHDLSRLALQESTVKDVDMRKYDFVCMCPPCTTASIAHVPPLRVKSAVRGIPGLTPRRRQMVDDANALFEFSSVSLPHATPPIRCGLSRAALHVRCATTQLGLTTLRTASCGTFLS